MNLCFDHFNLVAVIFQENIADISQERMFLKNIFL